MNRHAHADDMEDGIPVDPDCDCPDCEKDRKRLREYFRDLTGQESGPDYVEGDVSA